MSDDYFPEEYELDWEPHSAADELVERTIHSPVLTSYTAALDLLSDFDSEDLEDSEDEYDNFSKLKHKNTGKENGRNGKSKNFEKSKPVNTVNTKRTGVRQPVLWKSWRERLPSPEVPIWKDGQQPQLSLLKDWRQRMQATSTSAKVSKPSKSKGRIGRKGAITKPAPVKEGGIGGEGDASFADDVDPARAELPPTALHEGGNAEPKKPPGHGYLNGTASSLARKAVLQASSDENAATIKDKKRKASEPPDTNGSGHHTSKPKRGKSIKNMGENEGKDDVPDNSNPQRGEVGGKDDNSKKGTRGRPKGSSSASKVASTVASTRSTRIKNR